jgi:biotin carboxylase
MSKKKTATILIINWGTLTAELPLKKITKNFGSNVYLATTKSIPNTISKHFRKKNLIFTNPYESSALIKDVVCFSKDNKVDFDIVTTFFEMNTYQTSVLADFLGCKNYLPPSVALRTSVNKYLMRNHLGKYQINQPKFFLFNSQTIESAYSFFKKLSHDAIIKPVHSGHSYGSRFIKSNTDFETFKKMFFEAKTDLDKKYDEWMEYEDQLTANSFLIEEFIEGKMISCDGLVKEVGNITFIGSAEFELSRKPFLQQTGHVVPIASLSKEQINLCKKYVRKVVKSIGLKYCGFHCELKFCDGQPYLIEISGRLPGGVLLESYYHLSEFDIFDLFFSIFTEKIKINKNKSFYKSEVMTSLYSPQKSGLITRAKLPEKKSISEWTKINAVDEGSEFFDVEDDLGIRLIQLTMRSKRLTSKELVIRSRFLLSQTIFKVEQSFVLRLRGFLKSIMSFTL